MKITFKENRVVFENRPSAWKTLFSGDVKGAFEIATGQRDSSGAELKVASSEKLGAAADKVADAAAPAATAAETPSTLPVSIADAAKKKAEGGVLSDPTAEASDDPAAALATAPGAGKADGEAAGEKAATEAPVALDKMDTLTGDTKKDLNFLLENMNDDKDGQFLELAEKLNISMLGDSISVSSNDFTNLDSIGKALSSRIFEKLEKGTDNLAAIKSFFSISDPRVACEFVAAIYANQLKAKMEQAMKGVSGEAVKMYLAKQNKATFSLGFKSLDSGRDIELDSSFYSMLEAAKPFEAEVAKKKEADEKKKADENTAAEAQTKRDEQLALLEAGPLKGLLKTMDVGKKEGEKSLAEKIVDGEAPFLATILAFLGYKVDGGFKSEDIIGLAALGGPKFEQTVKAKMSGLEKWAEKSRFRNTAKDVDNAEVVDCGKVKAAGYFDDKTGFPKEGAKLTELFSPEGAKQNASGETVFKLDLSEGSLQIPDEVTINIGGKAISGKTASSDQKVWKDIKEPVEIVGGLPVGTILKGKVKFAPETVTT